MTLVLQNCVFKRSCFLLPLVFFQGYGVLSQAGACQSMNKSETFESISREQFAIKLASYEAQGGEESSPKVSHNTVEMHRMKMKNRLIHMTNALSVFENSNMFNNPPDQAEAFNVKQPNIENVNSVKPSISSVGVKGIVNLSSTKFLMSVPNAEIGKIDEEVSQNQTKLRID